MTIYTDSFFAKPHWHCDKHNLTIAGGERCFMCHEEDQKEKHKKDIDNWLKEKKKILSNNKKSQNGLQ